jgi:hypothetical protein
VSASVHVYCGPTIGAAEAAGLVPGAVTHPPVRHGDLLRLDPGPGLTVVIIDGVFHEVPSVRHKEILWLLAHDTAVVGAASMGALRAAELYPFGMIGVGGIYRAYRDGTLDGDDEVAVALTPGDWQAVSVALADVRAAAAQAAAAGVIDRAEAAALAGRAGTVHYAARTWAAIAAAARADLGDAMTRFRRWLDCAAPVPAKLRDAREALRLVAAGTLPAAPPVTWSAGRWGSCQLQDWLARWRGPVPFRDILAHQQLYGGGFPARWRRHVLSWVARSAGPAAGCDLPGAALQAARAAGLDAGYLTPAQAGYWLTPAEMTGLDDDEKLARILARAVPQDLTAPVWPVTAGQAGDLIDEAAGSDQAVARAGALNEQASRTGPYRRMSDLRAELIRAHLAAIWMTSPDDAAALTAAARDRGFASIAAAVEAARPFFLLEAGHAAAVRAAG